MSMREPRRFRPIVMDLLEDRILPSPIGGAGVLSTVIPLERLDRYAVVRHQEDLMRAQRGDAQVIFLGDSITDLWGDTGRSGVGEAVWMQKIAPMGAANFGVSGDMTENVLWRIANGELAGQPRVVVLEIGINNLGHRDTVDQTAAGIAAVVSNIRVAAPSAQVLLMGMFPAGQGKGDPVTQEVASVNARIAGLADGVHIHYLDIGAAFLNPDGTVSRELLPDGVHPSAAGYELWANAVVGPLMAMLGRPAPTAASAAVLSTDPAGDLRSHEALLAAETPILVGPLGDPAASSLPVLLASSNGPKAHKPSPSSSAWWAWDPAADLGLALD
jgi:lysophospholipase L1-like esterase